MRHFSFVLRKTRKRNVVGLDTTAAIKVKRAGHVDVWLPAYRRWRKMQLWTASAHLKLMIGKNAGRIALVTQSNRAS